MNSWKLYITKLNEIVSYTSEPMTLADKCGLYSAAKWLTQDLEENLKSDEKWDHYASEKIFKAMWSIGALTGFDVDNGHSAEQHRAWAYGALSTLKGLLDKKFPHDE